MTTKVAVFIINGEDGAISFSEEVADTNPETLRAALTRHEFDEADLYDVLVVSGPVQSLGPNL